MKRTFLAAVLLGALVMAGCKDSHLLDVAVGDMKSDKTTTSESNTNSKNDNSTHAAAQGLGGK